MTVSEEPAKLGDHQRTERLSHALYGLIIVTAALVAEQEFVHDATEALLLLLSTALVLLLAHTYSAYMAERTVEGRPLSRVARRLVVADNLPVLLAIVLPGLLFVLAGVGAIELHRAYNLSIAITVAALVGLGLYEGKAASMSTGRTVLSGLSAGAIGVLIVAAEAFFE